MGTKFYEFAESNLPYVQSISSSSMQPEPLIFQTNPQPQIPYQYQSIPSPFKLDKDTESTPTTVNKKLSQQSQQSQQSLRASDISSISKSKQVDQDKQALALKMIIGVMKKKKILGCFKQAKQDIIQKYNNPLIKDIPYPLLIDSYIQNIPYQERPHPYYIKLERLPTTGYKMPSSWVYLGQWFQDFPHGIGKMYHPAFKYQGYFHQGIPHLKGRRVSIDEIYEGEFVMNKREGFGRLVTRSQYFYQGEWRGDVREGEGYEIHRNGCIFEGEYSDDKVSVGSFYIPSHETKKKLNLIENYAYLNLIRTQFREKYYGEFSNNQFNGKGDYAWSDGRIYQGTWKNGKMHGEGSFTWQNGKRYEGGYVNNKKHGYGKFYNLSKTYEGFWEYGKPHGKGKITKDGETSYKIWHHGRIIREDNEAELMSMFSGQEEKFPSEMSPKLSEYQLQSFSSRELLQS